MAAMLLPLALLAIGMFVISETLLGSFIEVTDETIVEIQPNNDIQKQLLEVRAFLNGSLSATVPIDSRPFARKVDQIDGAFTKMLKAPFGTPREKALVIQARDRWRRVKEAGRIVARSADPKSDRNARQALAKIDIGVGLAVDALVSANEIDLNEIHSDLKDAKAGRLRGIGLVVAAFVLGFGGAALIGSILGRSIMGPLGLLGDGARRFGGGELSFRVGLHSDDELGRLGEAFNMMAQRLESDQAELEALATHDSLTGLYNRRELFRILYEEIARSGRYEFSFSVLMIDIDHFKAVNDSRGHQAGDRVLTGLARVMTDIVRPVDKIGRYGGEEFVVILPQTDRAGAWTTAERIRHAVVDGPISIGAGNSVEVTISIGIAVFPDDARQGDDLINRADIALYEAKEAGRNTTRRQASQK